MMDVAETIEAPRAGSRRLMIAVLRQAMADYWDADEQAARDARAWFASPQENPDTDGHFTFRQICGELQLHRANVLNVVRDEQKCRAAVAQLTRRGGREAL